MAKVAENTTAKTNDKEGLYFGVLPSGVSISTSKDVHKTNMATLVQTFGMSLKFFGQVVHEYYTWMRSLSKEERADIREFSVASEERYRRWQKEDEAEARAAFVKFFRNLDKGFTGLWTNIVTVLKNWDDVKEYADMIVSVKNAIDYSNNQFELSELKAQKDVADEKVRLNLELRKIELEGEFQLKQLEAEYSVKFAAYEPKKESKSK